MELHQARAIAERIRLQLAPYCQRIEIAGSIRRKKPEVKDIEIVCIPLQEPIKDLFQNVVGKIPHPEFCRIVRSWEKVKGDPSGKYTQRILPEGIKLDLFIVCPDNWGLQFAIRTGSADYSHKVLAATWCKKGYTSEDGFLRGRGGRIIPIPEEKYLFDIIGLPYVEPEFRNL